MPMTVLNDIEDFDLIEIESELTSANRYGDRHRHYQTLSKRCIRDALREFEQLLDEIQAHEKESGEMIPAGLVKFRYDGGAIPEDEIVRPEQAQTSAITLAHHEGRGFRLGAKPLPFYKAEDLSEGLRVSGYCTVKKHFIKE